MQHSTRHILAAAMVVGLAVIIGVARTADPAASPAAASETTSASGHWEGPGDCMACHRHNRG